MLQRLRYARSEHIPSDNADVVGSAHDGDENNVAVHTKDVAKVIKNV